MTDIHTPPSNWENTDEDRDAVKYHTATLYLLRIWPALLLIVGTIGNTLTLIVLQQDAFSKNTASVALRFLAVMDSMTLWTDLSRLWIKGLIDWDFREDSTIVCWLHFYFTLLSAIVTNWILVIITLTRLLFIKWPLKAPHLCTVCNYYGLMATITIFVSLAYTAIYWSISRADISNYLNSYHFTCSESIIHAERHTAKANVLLSMFLLVIGPATVLILLNSMIIMSFRELNKKRITLRGASQNSVTTKAARGRTRTETSLEPPRVSRIFSIFMDSRRALSVQLNKLRRFTKTGETVPRVDSNSHLTTNQKKPFLVTLIPDNKAMQGNEKEFRQAPFENKSLSLVALKKGSAPLKGSTMSVAKSSLILTNVPNYDSASQVASSVDALNVEQTRRLSIRSKVSSGKHSHLSNPRSDPSVKKSSFSSVIAELLQPVNAGVAFKSVSRQTELSPVSMKINQLGLKRSSLQNQSYMYRKTQALTLMVLLANTVFVCLNMPFCIYYIFAENWFPKSQLGEAKEELTWTIVSLLRYTNNAINFLVYCAFGSRFRHELGQLIEKKIKLFHAWRYSHAL